MKRTFAWLGNFRRLVVRFERRAENYLGFVQLGYLAIPLGCLRKIIITDREDVALGLCSM